MRATHSIYTASGGIPMCLHSEGICRACGLPGYGVPFDSWVKATFTDHDKLRPGEVICEACLFCFDDASQACAHKLNKPEPQRMRNYSHFVHRGEWYPLSKGDKRRMAELIFDASTVVLALSGQKHLCFRCPEGWWQIEETTVRPFPSLLKGLLIPVSDLYQGGFSKSEIESGNYYQTRIADYGVGRWQTAERLIQQHRQTLALQLAVFLAQKEEEDDAHAG